MDKQFIRRWGSPRRPFELELLSFVLVVLGLLYPLAIPSAVEATASTLHQQGSEGLLWVFGMLGGCVAYLALQQTTLNYNSTPAISLFAPLYFGGVCYGHIYSAAQAKGVTLSMANGGWGQIVGYPLALLGILILVARLCTLRRLLRYRGIEWDLVVAPVRDRTFFTDLGRVILPLFYRVKEYRLCKEGILIVGFHYLYAIPFRSIESIEQVEQFSSLQAATYYAGSSRSLIQVQASDHFEPIMFGPQRRDEVLHYCEHQGSEHLVVADIKLQESSDPRSGVHSEPRRQRPVAVNLRRALGQSKIVR